MPLLYGEGTKAFRRLQQEIIRNSNDQSILAGEHQLCVNFDDPTGEKDLDSMDDAFDYLFPSKLRAFMFAADLERPGTSSKYLAMTLMNHCLNIDLYVCPCWSQYEHSDQKEKQWLGILGCVYSDDYLSRPAILLHRLSSTEDAQPAFMRFLENGKTLVRISPVTPLQGNERVEISERGLKVWFNPNSIKMTNIDLFLQAPARAQLVRTPAININPTIGGHEGMTYEIQIRLPDLERTPEGHIKDVTFLIRNFHDLLRGMHGLLAIGDGSSHRFFVAYGFSAKDVWPGAPPKFDPWCRLLAWHQVIPPGKFSRENRESADILGDMARFNFLNNHPPEPIDETRLRDSMGWPERPGLRAQVEMTPNTFLDQTVYKLDISVWRIGGSSGARGSGYGGRGSRNKLPRR
ncbi:HET domain-containing protein [Fusarium sp. LHS14.1]|nr:HET domain-containing protein [Fusarium sp. LHS14.1]